jgi:hypothetical protein
MPDTALPDTTVITESFWTPNVRQQVITTCTSATRPTGVEGRYIHETDTELLYCYNGTGWEQVGGVGGWTSWTPVVTQLGAVDKTSASAYMRGPRRLIVARFNCVMTGSGTAANNINLSLPVPAAVSGIIVGSGYLGDNSTGAFYNFNAQLSSTTNFQLFATSADSAAPALGGGTVWSLALATNDSIVGTITYEAAT